MRHSPGRPLSWSTWSSPDALTGPATYVPVEISRSHLNMATAGLRERYPHLQVLPVCADFTRPFSLPQSIESRRRLVFFPGFAFGMGWLPAPPVRRWLVIAAAAYLLLVLPFAWHKIHEGFYLPRDWALTGWIREARAATEPIWWKSWIGGLRYLHFIALAYLAWAAVGPGGRYLSEGFRARGAAPVPVLVGAAIAVLISIPYTYVDEIKALSPDLDAWFLANIPIAHGDRIGLIQLVHLIAVLVLASAAIGAPGRQWLARDLVKGAVPVIRKVGTQSLAVFMVSIPLARFNGWLLDMIGKDAFSQACVNLFGFAILIITAYSVSWFKSQPWRARGPGTAAAGTPAAHSSGADGRGRPRLAAMRA